MASDLKPSERVYAAIKDAILSGELRLRQRLDIDKLSARWKVSTTPVRQALWVLTAERLVAQEGRSYHVRFWSERDLRALYQWRGQLAGLAIETLRAPPAAQAATASVSYPDRYMMLMRQLEGSANEELKRAADDADNRLRAALVVEPVVLPEAEAELAALEVAARSDVATLSATLRGFFERRAEQSNLIRGRAGMAALPRNGDG